MVRHAVPDRDGVGASHVQVTEGQARTTALAFLQARFPAVAPETWRARFERGLVLWSDGRAIAPDTGVTAGDDLYYYRELPAEPRIHQKFSAQKKTGARGARCCTERLSYVLS